MNTLRAENYVKDMADAIRLLAKAARGKGKRNSSYVKVYVDPTLTDEQLERIKNIALENIKYGIRN